MKKQGFTLIELLAVIVILAIIALIAIPTILGVIEKARKSSAEQSALGYIDAVEKQIAINELDESKTNIVDGVYEVSNLRTLGVSIKGENPSDNSWVQISKNVVTNYSLKFKDYTVTYGNDSVKNGEIKTKPSEEITYTVYRNGTAIYYNPETNQKCDDYTETNSTTGTKTGCMKWYAFNDKETSSTVNMILDHNTTAKIAWNIDNKNVAYEDSNIKPEIDKLVSVSKWISIPRLISAEEVNEIIGKTDWLNSGDWYCFESKQQDSTTSPYCNNVGTYGWLYDYMYCKEGSVDWKCYNNDTSTYGYWTSTTYGIAGSGSDVWGVTRRGRLDGYYSSNSGRGIRPVITISKSIIK